jgi:hypothetical protein
VLPGDPNDLAERLPDFPGSTEFGNVDDAEIDIEGNGGWRQDLVDDTRPARHVISWFGYGWQHRSAIAYRALK